MRLDKVAEPGLPIWITELSMEEADENIKGTAVFVVSCSVLFLRNEWLTDRFVLHFFKSK